MNIKVSVNDELKEKISSRADDLGVSNSEYLRIVATLDLNIQKYQRLVTYINVVYNDILDLQERLNQYANPLQEAPLIRLDE